MDTKPYKTSLTSECYIVLQNKWPADVHWKTSFKTFILAKMYSMLNESALVSQATFLHFFFSGILKIFKSIFVYLVDDAGDEWVLTHGWVVVQVTGAVFPTLLFPQQAGDVDHRAERYGAWDPTQSPDHDPLDSQSKWSLTVRNTPEENTITWQASVFSGNTNYCLCWEKITAYI